MEFLKELLSEASEHGLLQRGLYVPTGLHLMEGKSLVTNILQKHMQYLEQVKGVPLTGLSQKKMTTEIRESVSAKDLISGIKGIQSVEKVQDRTYPGQWTLIIDKNHES